jgi:NADH-quinone oxidoreductase subunit J
MVLFLFVIMLLNLKRDPTRERSKLARRTFGGVLVLVLLAEIGLLLHQAFFAPASGAANPILVGINNGAPGDSVTVGNTVNIGKQLFTTYILPFEIASVLLLAAIIGAVILAKRKLTP